MMTVSVFGVNEVEFYEQKDHWVVSHRLEDGGWCTLFFRKGGCLDSLRILSDSYGELCVKECDRLEAEGKLSECEE